MKYSNLFVKFTAISALLFSVAIYTGKSSADEKIVLTGSSTIAPLMAEIGKQFEADHPGIRVDVQSGGSSRGIIDARKGLADIGMVSRDLNPNEHDLQKHTVALDGVALILNTANPVQALTEEQVVNIYTGKITNWREVGGNDEPIIVVNKAEGRSTLELFLHYFKLSNSQIKAKVIIGDNEQGIKTVSGDKRAIGYVSIGTAEYQHEQGIPIKLLALKGVVASVSNVTARKFPLMRELNLVTQGKPSPLVTQFIEYAQSNRVKAIIGEMYFVPLI